jgi:hypothetical protein
MNHTKSLGTVVGRQKLLYTGSSGAVPSVPYLQLAHVLLNLLSHYQHDFQIFGNASPKSSTPGFFPKIKRQTQGVDLSGQVANITGANTGLGFHCARHLLALKLSGLILAVRSRENGEEAVAKLQKEFPAVRLEVWELEMTSYESIQSFTRRVETDLARLDITILNSGLAPRCIFSVPTNSGTH